MRLTKRILLGLMLIALGALISTAYWVTAQVEKESVGDGELVTVLVSTETIPANQELDPLIARGVFVKIGLPADALVEDAITDLRQLRGATTTATILNNEQISSSRISIALYVDPA